MLPKALKMKPLLLPKVWGGRALGELFDKELPDHQPYGESWEVADLPEGSSCVDGGPLNGRTLTELVDTYGTQLTGSSRDGRFPLLVKLLDAADDLSVQVHPAKEDESKWPGAKSKDECWYILKSEPGASIIYGLAKGKTRADFINALKNNTMETVLRNVPVSQGDCYRVSPGTIHAICAGTRLLEVQEPSDTTYRIWDWNRPGLDGKPRPLHIEQALAVSRFDAAPTAIDKKEGELISVPGAYRIQRLSMKASRSWTTTSPAVVHVLEGALQVDEVMLNRAETAVILPQTSAELIPRPGATIVVADVP